MLRILIAVALCVSIDVFAVEKLKTDACSKSIECTPATIDWRDGTDKFPHGALVAKLEGDPMKPGPFTVRLRLLANTRLYPHFHEREERVTVLSGTIGVGYGESLDLSAVKDIPTGGFFLIPPKTVHFLYAQKEVEIQVTGVGPWESEYNFAPVPQEKVKPAKVASSKK